MKYYFIVFMYGASESDKMLTNGVIKCHPLEWRKLTNKLHPGQYVLLSWNEITEDEYNEFGGEE